MAKFGTEVSPGHPIYGQDKGELYNDGWEVGLSTEFIVDDFIISAGGLYAKNGATEESLTYLFWGNDSVSAGTGVTWNVNEAMTATLGVLYTHYFPITSEALSLDYKWYALDIALGMTYHF